MTDDGEVAAALVITLVAGLVALLIIRAVLDDVRQHVVKRLEDMRNDMDHRFGDMYARLSEIRDDVSALRRKGSDPVRRDR